MYENFEGTYLLYSQSETSTHNLELTLVKEMFHSTGLQK